MAGTPESLAQEAFVGDKRLSNGKFAIAERRLAILSLASCKEHMLVGTDEGVSLPFEFDHRLIAAQM